MRCGCFSWIFPIPFPTGRLNRTILFGKQNEKEYFSAGFIKLLREHIYEKRSVGFYASELCVSPQYLNRIIKNMSGKTVYAWIAHMLTAELYRLLADTDISIQSLADHFNFPDQATFTKFFKRQSGISPTAYRRKTQNLSECGLSYFSWAGFTNEVPARPGNAPNIVTFIKDNTEYAFSGNITCKFICRH